VHLSSWSRLPEAPLLLTEQPTATDLIVEMNNETLAYVKSLKIIERIGYSTQEDRSTTGCLYYAQITGPEADDAKSHFKNMEVTILSRTHII
jgi:hypothetical protein